MFTGIVEDTGEVLAVEDDASGRRVRISTGFEDLSHGQSISVSGACLTVEEYEPGEWFSVFLAAETVDRTFFDSLETGDAVNLERAMPADGRFDGHVVQGHVDATAEVVAVESVGEGLASDASETSSDESDGDWTFTFSLPEELTQYLVEKGSITVDGISLTVADRDESTFSVAIIPATYDLTTLSAKAPGDPVHLEVDVIAKYVERMV
ncbi:riboflavin synthase [Halobacteria archaeon HArc-gm2]|nr:riboflavin synthase [Halobacteria archaeon HArc-gm2]